MSKFCLREQFPVLGPMMKRIPAISYATGRAALSAARKSRGLVKRTWRWGLSIVLVIVVAHTAATFIFGRQLADEIGKIKARGEYVSCSELAGPPIPDSENGALIYEKAFRLLPEPSRPTYSSPPPLGAGAPVDSPALWKEACAQARQCVQVLPLVEQAQALKQCRFKTNWEDGSGLVFPHCRKLMQLARILAADAVIRAKDGDGAGACRSLRMLFAAQRSIEDDPDLGCCHVRAQIIAVGRDAILRMGEFQPVPEGDARKLSDYIATIDLAAGLLNSMRGERARVIEFFDIIRKEGNPIACLCAGPPPPIDVVDLYFSYPGRPWLYRDERNLLLAMEHQIALAARPYREVGSAGWEKAYEQAAACGWVGAVACVGFGRTHAVVETAHAEARASGVLLALRVYKDRSGSYPLTLGDLERSLHWNLNLEDPFSGKEFVYKRQGSGLLLYSIGQNLKDDGGVENDSPDEGDIVWQFNH